MIDKITRDILMSPLAGVAMVDVDVPLSFYMGLLYEEYLEVIRGVNIPRELRAYLNELIRKRMREVNTLSEFKDLVYEMKGVSGNAWFRTL
jgi:hypothetical protein